MAYQRIHTTQGLDMNADTISSNKWQSDDTATNCSACHVPFTFIRRRSHCRKCGRVICNLCSQPRCTLPGYGYNDVPVRICIECNCELIAIQRGIHIDSINQQLNQYLDKYNHQKLYQSTPDIRAQLNDKLRDIAVELQSIESHHSDNSTTMNNDPQEYNHITDELHIEQLNQLAKLAAETHDRLIELRSTTSHITIVILPNNDESTNITPLHYRYLIITVQPQQCIALTGLIHQNKTLNAPHQWRYNFIYSLSELQSIRNYTQPYNKLYQSISNSYITIFYQSITSIQSNDTDNSSNKRIGSTNTLPISTDLVILESLSSSKHHINYTHCTLQQDELIHTIMHHIHRYDSYRQLQVKAIDHIYHDMHETVTWSDASHIQLLHKLWCYSFGSEQQMPIGKCESWKLLGFQSDNPLTDFRGCGLLALNILVELAEIHTQFIRQLIQLQSTRHYPLSCVIINLINVVIGLLGLHNINNTSHSKLYNNNTLYELLICTTAHQYNLVDLVVCLLALIDYHCMEHQYTYMQFPLALNYVKHKLYTIIMVKPIDLYAVCSMLVHDTAWANIVLDNIKCKSNIVGTCTTDTQFNGR